jgi:hypothetical protein
MGFELDKALLRSREDWLLKAVKALETRVLEPAGLKAPSHVWCSVGWPKGSRGKAKAIGQCWPRIASADKSGHIFISPSLDNGSRVLDVLLHEIGHDVVGCEHGHKKPFADFAKKVGLVKPWTATTASEELQATLVSIVAQLGDYPHPSLQDYAAGKKQTTRMRKYECPGCGQIVRAAKDDLQIACVPCEVPYEQEAV